MTNHHHRLAPPALVCIALSASAAIAETGLSIEISVDRAAAVIVFPVGVPTATPNASQYGGTQQVDGSTIGWQIFAEGAPDVANTPKLIGSVSIANQTMIPRAYVVTLRQPALTACPFENQMGGSALGTLLVDFDGGGIQSAQDQSLWRALIDDREVALLLYGVDIASEGFGTVLVGPESFGDPIPSDPAPGVTESIGLRFAFTLTGGETISISSIFTVAFLDLDCLNPADLDGDGIVGGKDLGILLALWGSDDPFADLNGDGVVDGADLGALLQAWTDR